MTDAPVHLADGRWVGRSLRRVEDPALVRGQGRFTADLKADHFVRFVRSPLASGRIVKIEAPEGARMFTAADLAAVKPIQPMLHKFNYRPIAQPILARDVVRFVGEPVAAILGRTDAEAEDFADQVELDIETLDALVTADEALGDNAPLVHDEAPRNVIVEGIVKTPDFDATWAKAAKIVRIDARSRRQNATPMEARAGHASFDPSTGRVTLTCTSQMPHLFRTTVCDALDMPESELRVIAPDVGGGFGQKMSVSPEYVMLVFLARRLRTSIAWTEDRRENLIASYHSRDQQLSLEGAFDADGKLLALSGDIVANIGAYSCFPTTCGVEPLMAMAELPGPYDFRAYACRSRGVATHTCPIAPYRGVSRPSITFVLELLMDKAACELGIDPVDIRRKNLIAAFPYTSATGLVFDEASYRETLEMAAKAIDVPAFRVRQKAARAKGKYLGLGFGTFSERTGYGTPAFAARGMGITPGWEQVEMAMDPSGFVELKIGASPHGQGLRTTLSQIVADQLGINPNRIRVVHGDTDRTPYGFGTFASRSLVIAGGASVLAARKVRVKLLQIAGHFLEAAPEDIVLEDGNAKVAGTDRTIPIRDLARAAYHGAHQFQKDFVPGLAETATYDPGGTFSNACHVAIVEVDIETGGVKIEKYLVAEDAGRIINPMIADGQIHGGVAQGIGNALYEEIVYDETGNILTSTLADFMPPTAHEIPPIELHHRETYSPATITEAKGLGEGGGIGAPAAIVNAINDALSPFGVSVAEIPATPQRIRAALRAAEQRS
ncbi:caffeine dehydrogenase subunit alpha [Variibacter gotjawalensis]|uniref:Caffeine dehydrogenase subunit alpha n=1 Tax=Variibacter gotjawalensis TaxID=1333996 RepID=A0A0S3PQQ7_9BRAD|nr:xanthine dehydrogenase family protein molybdopterin-binding subunit [Variibacter gotjawalensis]NIK48410.1 carbon-monoxide dehydrogenase large subunit [Variibacter gotjawalensis]RZS50277.1 xanthine dehydrogenase molybdenum binding subunit apoprotein [Variibacter gotjawalensis]BAT58110.1 caffeine dehydrogenase subunit alpha [Variibacter gotjawalensis]